MKSELLKHVGWLYAKNKEEEGKYFNTFDHTYGNRKFKGGYELERKIEEISDFNIGDYDDAESCLIYLNGMIDEKPYTIDMPHSSGYDDYIISLENGVDLHIRVEDEYNGGGDYEAGIYLVGFCFDEFDPEKILEAAKWLAPAFNY